jgi:hypothetical protein
MTRKAIHSGMSRLFTYILCPMRGRPDVLLQSIKEGRELDLSPGTSALEEVELLGEGSVIEAARIRDILVGLHKSDSPTAPDPRGIRIRGTWIRGELDLAGIDSKIGLRLSACRLDTLLTLHDASLPWLSLDTCVLSGVTADGAQISTLTIYRCELIRNHPRGALRLVGTHVTNELTVSDTLIINSAGPAITATGLNVGAGACLDGLIARGEASAPGDRGSRGALCVSGAVISGNLSLRSAVLVSETLPALMAENLTVKGNMGCCEEPGQGFSAIGSSELGAICVPGATISGQLSLRGTVLTNDAGPGLMAELVTVQDSALLDQGFKAVGEGYLGAVCLRGAKITGNLSLCSATLRNGTGPALVADGLTAQDMMMTSNAEGGRRFDAAGCGNQGTIRLMRASIGGQLSLERAKVTNLRAPANKPLTDPGHGLANDGTGADNGLAPKPRRSLGAVCLSNAMVSGNMILRNAELNCATGAALMADYLTVKGDAFICERGGEGFTAIGSGELGAVCLAGATINGQLSLGGAILANATGPALMADCAQIQGAAYLDEGFYAEGARDSGAVCLVDASVGKELTLSGNFVTWYPGNPIDKKECPALDLTRAKVGTLIIGPRFAARGRGFTAHSQLKFDGLTYSGLPFLDDLDSIRPSNPQRSSRRRTPDKDRVDQWLYWLQSCTPEYAAQPYQALASAYEGAGYDGLARHILIRQCDDEFIRGSLTPIRRAGRFFSKWLIGYGYHCVAALAWLAGLFLATALFAGLWLGPHKYIAVAPPAGQAASSSASAGVSGAAECTIPGDIGYAIGIAFPVINLNGSSEEQCSVPATGAWWVTAFGWVVRVLAALLAGVYVLGISGLNRGSPSSSAGAGSLRARCRRACGASHVIARHCFDAIKTSDEVICQILIVEPTS